MTAAFALFLQELNAQGAERADGFSVDNFPAMTAEERTRAIVTLAELAPGDATAIGALGFLPYDQARAALIAIRPLDGVPAGRMAYARALLAQGITDPDPVAWLIETVTRHRDDMLAARDAVDTLAIVIRDRGPGDAMQWLLDYAARPDTDEKIRNDIGIAYLTATGQIDTLDNLTPRHFEQLSLIKQGNVAAYLDAATPRQGAH